MTEPGGPLRGPIQPPSSATQIVATAIVGIAGTQNLQTLDLLRLQVGLNVLHGWVTAAELHVTGGVLGMHGNDWTPGGSVRTDLRLYPFRPLSFEIVGDATFFAHGPPLVEAQALPGATFARLDLRLGMGMLFQPGVAPSIGPRLQVGVRF